MLIFLLGPKGTSRVAWTNLGSASLGLCQFRVTNLAICDADGKMQPLEAHGVRCMSMGFLMPPESAASWRGPLVMSAVQTLVSRVAWSPLDVLVLDMPPGTGELQHFEACFALSSYFQAEELKD